MSSHDDGRSKPSRILHVRDFPREIEPKELEDLFRNLEGYVTIRKLAYFAFVEFNSTEAAAAAMAERQGHRFSTYDKPLVIDFDKDAAFPRKRKAPDYDRAEGRFRGPPLEREESLRGSSPHSMSRYSDRDFYRREERRGFYAPPSGFLDLDYRRPRGDRHSPPPYYGDPYMFGGMGMRGMFPFPPNSHGHSYESSTLFVGSMPSDVTEREMSVLFRFMAGCKSVRLIKREDRPAICFVDFIDPACATVAMNYLQGYKLDKDCIGLSIEYDKGAKHEREGKERDKYLSDKRERGDRDERRDRSSRERESERDRI